MNSIQFSSFLTLCLLSAYATAEASTLNRMLDYWQPSDVYVIFNSTTAAEDDGSIGAMTHPRFVSAQGDFSNFIRQNPIWSVFPDNFVLVLFTDDSCQSAIPILRDQLSQAIIVKRSKVVIVAAQIVSVKIIEEMFRGLWKMGLLNVFLLDDAFVYGFNPFTNEFPIQCKAKDYLQLISVDRATNFHGFPLNIPLIELYPEAQNITWHNRSIQIGNFFEVLRPLAGFFNATLRVYTPKVVNFGFEYFENNTKSVVHPGIGEELVKGRGDLTVSNRGYGNSNYFDFLMPLHFRDCKLLIPKSRRIPQYTMVALVVFSWVGLFTIITLVVLIIIAVVMKRILRIKLDMIIFSIELGSVFLGQNFQFAIQAASMRIIVICWLMVCICLGPIFNAQIVTSFSTPMFGKNLDGPFDALQGEGFSVYTFDDFLYFLKGNSKQLFPSEEKFQLLLKNLRGVSREEFFDRVLHPNERDMFIIISMAENLLEKTKYLTDQTYSYHKTKPIFNSLIANIVPRGSIIYNHYNDFNYRIFEAGLLQHWKTLELLYEIKFGSSNEAQKKPLTTEDLYSAFLVPVLGYGVAATVFAVEMLRAKFF